MLIINKNDYKKIIEEAKKGKPNEVCGILAGKNYEVFKVYKMKNISDNPRFCYFMSPEEQLKVFKEIRGLGFELVGIYHSHPESDPYPSKRDVELAFYPEAVYIIISLKDEVNPVVKGFRIVEEKIVEEEIKVV